MKFWGQETVFDQVEVIQVVAVQAVQGGTQTFADNGPGTTAGRYRPPRRRILGYGIVGRTRQDARWQSDHGVRKCRLPHLICATHFWTVVVVSLLRWCTYLQSFSRDEICLFKFLTAFLFALSQELQCCWCMYCTTVPTPHWLSLFLAHQPCPHWKSQITHSDMHYLVSGINSLIHSISLASHVLTHLLIHLSVHLYYYHHSHHPSLFHSRLKNYPFSKSFPLETSFTYRTAFMTTGLDRTYHVHRFILVSHFNFLFVPCGGLSWLLVSFLLHVKYTLSYRMCQYWTK